jgi:hypothetical protein
MFRGGQLLVAAIMCTAALIPIGCRTHVPAEAGAAGKPDRNVLLHAPGTIVSVEERAHDEQSEDLLPGPHVCYTIDSFAEIPTFERAEYETAERTRMAKQGPRCHDTAVDPSAVHLKPGDHADVYFRLEDGAQISIVRISIHGVDL